MVSPFARGNPPRSQCFYVRLPAAFAGERDRVAGVIEPRIADASSWIWCNGRINQRQPGLPPAVAGILRGQEMPRALHDSCRHVRAAGTSVSQALNLTQHIKAKSHLLRHLCPRRSVEGAQPVLSKK